MKVVVVEGEGLMDVETALCVRDHGHEVTLVPAPGPRRPARAHPRRSRRGSAGLLRGRRPRPSAVRGPGNTLGGTRSGRGRAGPRQLLVRFHPCTPQRRGRRRRPPPRHSALRRGGRHRDSGHRGLDRVGSTRRGAQRTEHGGRRHHLELVADEGSLETAPSAPDLAVRQDWTGSRYTPRSWRLRSRPCRACCGQDTQPSQPTAGTYGLIPPRPCRDSSVPSSTRVPVPRSVRGHTGSWDTCLDQTPTTTPTSGTHDVCVKALAPQRASRTSSN